MPLNKETKPNQTYWKGQSKNVTHEVVFASSAVSNMYRLSYIDGRRNGL